MIADDERPAREYLRRLLEQIDGAEVIGEAANGAEAVLFIRRHRPDLVLLDLQMPEMSGIDAVRELAADEMPLVAFVTAFDDHAIKAFELNALDYLLKPVELSRLQQTFQRAAERMKQHDWRSDEAERVNEAAAAYDAPRLGLIERIPVRKRGEIFLISVSDVAVISADGELLHITTTDGDRFDINYRLKDIELRLDPQRFMRLSRSAIVNADHVTSIVPVPGGTYIVTMCNGVELSSSRTQSKIMRDRFLRL